MRVRPRAMKKPLLAFAALALVLAACGSPSAGITPAAQQSNSGQELERIDCQVTYNAFSRGGQNETLSVQATSDGRLQVDRARFKQMVVRIRYSDDTYESPVFNVIVKSRGAREDLEARAYQLERVGEQGGPDTQGGPAKRPENEFVGGHGFTGLGYVFDPDSNAEIQYYCEAF